MKTEIFESWSAFYQREDKSLNGVSKEFAELHPDYEKQNETNDGCWNCSRCSRCSDCSDCSGCSHCSHCSDCSGCSGCSHCSDCSDCSDCSGCSGCSDCSGCSHCSHCSHCSDCSDCSGCSGCSRCSDCSGCSRCSDLTNARPVEQSESNPIMIVPIIENIHQKVFEAVTATDDSLNMDTWHTCETTHCRAGWVVQLAGEEGKKLELQTSTLFAAQQIYFKSSPKINVSPTRFYESNEVALKDMERCAKEEIELNKN